MKRKIWTGGVLLFLSCICSFSVFADSDAEKKRQEEENVKKMNQFQEMRLSPGQLYTIYTKMGDGVTTITFPSKIGKIAGMNVSLDGKGSDFILSTKAGSYYFSVAALKENASGTLTITYNRKSYILYLKQSNDEAYASVNFIDDASGGALGDYRSNVVSKTPSSSPARLVSLLDMAKSYDIIAQSHPNSVTGTIREKYKNIYDFGKFRIHLLDVIRFDRDDTLVFKLIMENMTPEEIAYDKYSFSAQVKGQLFYMSVSDASGIMPPQSRTWAFFAITGTSRGGRNNLQPKNDWLIGVTTKDMQNQLNYTVPSKDVFEKTQKSSQNNNVSRKDTTREDFQARIDAEKLKNEIINLRKTVNSCQVQLDNELDRARKIRELAKKVRENSEGNEIKLKSNMRAIEKSLMMGNITVFDKDIVSKEFEIQLDKAQQKKTEIAEEHLPVESSSKDNSGTSAVESSSKNNSGTITSIEIEDMTIEQTENDQSLSERAIGVKTGKGECK